MSGLAPFGAHGGGTACPRCGGTEVGTPGHCADCGGFVQGNRESFVTGTHSLSFMLDAESKVEEIVETILRTDKGYAYDPTAKVVTDAPRALYAIARGQAQAEVLRDALFRHIVALGGPLTASERVRRCYDEWTKAADRVVTHVRVVGLERGQKPVAPLDAVRRAVAEADDA